MKATFTVFIALVLTLFSLPAAQVFIPTNAVWKYLDNGSDQGTVWRGTNFNDASWASGPAQFGYGEGDEATAICCSNAPIKFVTYYFRRAFSATNAATYTNLLVRLKRDDGAIVYLNGSEVLRSSMADGPVSYTNLAFTAADDGQVFLATPISANLLREGTNIVAVEVHQAATNSSDMSFALEMVGNLPLPAVNITSPANGTLRNALAALTVNATASDSDGTIQKVVFYANGLRLGEDTNSPYSLTWSNVLAGSYSFKAVAIDNDNFSSTSTVVNVTVNDVVNSSNILVSSGSAWKYLDTGAAQGTAWKESIFDDSDWSSGLAQLGYGDGDEANVISFGPNSTNKFITTYFRRSFAVTNVSRFTNLLVRLLRDDGAVVYLNGTEVFRNNLPQGPIVYTNLASDAGDDGTIFFPQPVVQGLLEGTNVLAVEIHQAATNSSDLSFDLELRANIGPMFPTALEDFESGGYAWVVENGTWEVGVPTGVGTPPSGTNVAGTVLSGGGYPEVTSARLVGPAFTVPTVDQNPRLRFWQWFSFGGGDNGQVQVRVGTNATWQTLATYSGSGGGVWSRATVDLSNYGGQAVQIGFLLTATDCCGFYDGGPGWFVDEVLLATGAVQTLIANVPQSFESGEGEWSVQNGTWEVGKPTGGPGSAHSGTNCAGTVLSGAGYPEVTSARLVGPAFTVPTVDQNPRLRFWQWFSFGGGDNGQVQVRVGTNATWQTLATYSGSGGGVWSRATVDLSNYGGQAVQIGFLLTATDCCGFYDGGPGWFVDEVLLATGAVQTLIANVPQSFESGEGEWSVQNGTWEVGKPTGGPGSAHSGTNCAGTVLSGAGYPEVTSARLVGPAFTVPTVDQNPRLRFWQWFSFGGGDNGQVQVRVGTNATWQTLATYSGSGGGVWSRATVDLSNYGGQAVQIGFLLTATDCCGFYDGGPGWFVDEVLLATGAVQTLIANVPQSFESGEGEWSVQNGTWEVGKPTGGPGSAHSGTNCAGTVLSGAGYPEVTSARLVGPAFTVPTVDQNPRLRFWQWFSFGGGDNGQVQVRVGTNATWQTLATYSGSGGGVWSRATVDLSNYGGQAVQIGFLLTATDCCGFYDGGPGWFVDEVLLATGAVQTLIANVPQSFESGEGEWSVQNGTWEVGKPTGGPGSAHSGTNCAGTVLSGAGYPEVTSARLVGPAFTVPTVDQNPRLRFWQWFSFGGGDNGQVQVRVGTNATWQTLATYSGSGGGVWSRATVDLSNYGGQAVQIGFLLTATDCCGFYDGGPGWFVDEVTLKTGSDIYHNPETFESSWGDWDADNYSLWKIGIPTGGPPLTNGSRAFSPVSVAATLLSGDYSANSSGRLISPEFLVPGATADGLIVMRFWQWYQYGTGDNGQVQVSVSTGNGWSEWTTLASTATNGTSTNWVQAIVDISAYAGQIVRLGFRHTANNDGSVGKGWMIDDITVSDFIPITITLGNSAVFNFTNNHLQYFAVDVPPGGHLRVRLNTTSGQGLNGIYLRRGALPTAGSYDARFTTNGANQSVLVPDAGAGRWYVLVLNSANPGEFTLETEFLTGTIVDQITPKILANGGIGTIAVTGAGFEDSARVFLVSPGRTIEATNVDFLSTSRLVADFFLLGEPTNNYSVQVVVGTNTATLTNALTLISAGEARLVTRLVTPSQVGPGAPATIIVEYANEGTAAMPAPLLVLTGTDGARMSYQPFRLVRAFWTSAQPIGFSETVQLLASGSTPGLLQPGERFRVPVQFIGLSAPDGFTVRFDLGVISQNSTLPNPNVPWDTLKAQMRPVSIPADAWEPIWNNFVSATGPLWTDYVRMLNSNAAYLARLGLTVNDVNDLLAFAIAQADGMNIIRSLGSSTDAAMPAPGLNLSFGRFFPQNLSGRYRLGPLGRGWSHNWETALSEAADGTVTVTGPGGSRRIFQPDRRTGGVYFSDTGDHGTFTKSGGTFTLTESRGLKRIFAADGKLIYAEDPNGNRITTTHSGNLLTKLTHSSGQSLTLNYAGGLLQSVIDSVGRATTYSYDPGQHLQNADYFDGTSVIYSYATGLGAAREHALTQIAYPGGTHEFFSYDANGRLATMQRDGGAEAITFGYEGAGLVSVTDTFANKSRFYLNHRGLMAKMENPLRQTLRFTYDGEFNLTSLTDPAGRSHEYAYDANGNLIENTDPLGGRTRFLYGALNRLATLTDAKGNLTRYAHDTKGNLNAITYANNSLERWSYDARGNPTTWTNRRAHAIGYQFNTNGQLTAKNYPDGSRSTYGYDARGNLTLASNYVGAIALSYYTNDRLRRITYPGNRWLEYTYDLAGLRTSMSDQLGYRQDYLYDSLGRLRGLTNATGELVRYDYDTAGRLALKTLGNGVFTTYHYDAAGQLLALTNRQPNNNVLSFFNYIYDTRGRRTGMQTHYGAWTYGYDDLGQLTRAVLVSTSTNVPNQDLTYVYDALGNRIRTIENGLTTLYTANNLNQYTRAGGLTLNYDADGSLTQKLSGATTVLAITNDFENRLSGFGSTNGQRRFDYDALGFPTAVWRDGIGSFQVHDLSDLGDLVSVYGSGGNVTERRAHGFGTVNTEMGATNSFLTLDAIGNVSDLTVAGVANISQAFRPFGEQIKETGKAPSQLGFGGEFGVIQENDLMFMRARFYDSILGRFLSDDPSGPTDGPNLYAYGQNNPGSFIDPSGLISWGSEGGPWMGRIFEERGGEPFRFQWRRGDSLWHAAWHKKFGPHVAKDNIHWYWNRKVISGKGNVIINPYLNGKVTLFGRIGSAWGAGTLAGELGIWLGEGLGNGVYDLFHPNDVGNWVDAFGNPIRPDTREIMGGPGNSAEIPNGIPRDPNEKTGPAGYDTNHNYLAASSLFAYRIDFENATNAAAPAQVVLISDSLTNVLDWSTLELTEIAFGDRLLTVPAGSQHFTRTEHVSYLGVNFDVKIEVGLNPTNGVLTARFDSINPLTGLPPSGASVIGFLPPENGTGRGKGHVSFTVRPQTALPTGTQIRNVAFITFDPGVPGSQTFRTDLSVPTDPNSPPSTNRQALVTIDASLPSSFVNGLPTSATNSTFTVCWAGSDLGSGVVAYDVYVSTNSGPWTLWLANTTNTCATFSGQNSKAYGFYSVARDGVGNAEPIPAMADTVTTTQPNYPPMLLSLTDQITFVGKTFFVTNRALDLDFPSQQMTFSLAANAPAGASVNSTNGLFRWQPTRDYGSTTNVIRVVVTDNGSPSLSATGSFTVIIADYLEPNIGSTVVRAGQSTNVPLTIFSSVAITSPVFALEYPAGRLSGFALSNLSPTLISALLQNVTTTQSLVYLTNAAGQSLLGTQQIARLVFAAASNQPSAFIPVIVTDLQAKRLDGANVFSLADGTARMVVLGEEPLLEALASTNGQVRLVLYGQTGTTNRIEFTTNLPGSGPWTLWQSAILSNLFQALPSISPTNQTLFFRAVRQ